MTCLLKRSVIKASVLSPVVGLMALMIMPGSAEAMPASPTASAEAKSWAPMVAQVELRKPANASRSAPSSLRHQHKPPSNSGVVFGSNGCPEGSSLIMWDAPIYDEEGLFVVDFEPTPVCIPDDLEPEG